MKVEIKAKIVLIILTMILKEKTQNLVEIDSITNKMIIRRYKNL